MKFASTFKGLALAACVASTFSVAQAQTFSNVSDNSTSIYYMGSPDTTSYGQFFSAPGGVLNDFTFYATGGTAGNVDLVIAAWDGSKAVGPALYTSAELNYGGGAQALGASGINLALTANTNYIAYLTVAGVSNPMSTVAIQGSNSNGGLGGGFRFLNSGLVDPLTQNQAWSNWSVPNMSYTAVFAPVPEADTYAMLLAGLGVFGLMQRRKASKA